MEWKRINIYKVIVKAKVYLVCILVILIAANGFISYREYVQIEKIYLSERAEYFDSLLKSEQNWLASLQLSNGAIAFRQTEEGEVSIIPYFSCITAIALLQPSSGKDHSNLVKSYFDWHFEHLNDSESDKNGVSGTIYDYQAYVSNGSVKWEKTEEKYDSTDAYAALFLIALWEYYKQTGDSEYLIDHFWLIRDVINAMNVTIDRDGLSYAKPQFPVKYLMDNTEVYKGFSAAINIYEEVFLTNYKINDPEYSTIEQDLDSLKERKLNLEKAIQVYFWNEKEKRYEAGLDQYNLPLTFEGWSNFYPDDVAQLFPIINGLVEPESEKAISIYNLFSSHHDWESMEHYTSGNTNFYWGLTAYCGALMKDEERLLKYINHYIDIVWPEYNYPAYNADVAWVALASSEMFRYYENEIKRIDPFGLF